MNKPPFYITTTLPYVNAEPHIGHGMEFIRADIIARSKKLAGYDVFFNTGTDEHGIKVYQKAQQLHVDTQIYVDQTSLKFKEILPALGVSSDINFIRTTDPHHVKAAQEFWRIVNTNGYIYKKNYSIKYCIGCELEKTESELVNGRCPIHTLQDLEIIAEENYFFKFSSFQEKLLKLYADRPDFVIPHTRLNEIKAFVERGLEDFSISRIATKMPWGIPVPDDEAHVMYVWFDALVSYISAIGWPESTEVPVVTTPTGTSYDVSFQKWWVETGGVVQYCGKDNLRQQSAMWQAMLMAAGLTSSKTIVVNGFVTGDGGIKMSKSLGNVVNPLDVVKEYGTDALRYYVAREISPFEDSPFTMDKFKEAYNANLANGIGNLTSRIMKMSETNLVKPVDTSKFIDIEMLDMSNYDIRSAMDAIWSTISALDELIQKEQPFKLIKENKVKGSELITKIVQDLYFIGFRLKPFLPNTSAVILKCIEENKTPGTPLFMRK